ncbi:unnamed protein product [Cercospora beticola]|nr:unnamed protein product [Cercospora beticola]
MPQRWIDRVPPRTEEAMQMQVMCLGLSRTGTMSMWTALQILGYKPYHFKEIGKPENLKDRHLVCWREAFYAKLYGSGEPYATPEFEKLLQRYDAITDAPAVNFSDELIEAFPKAKIILSRREPEQWLKSMLRSYHAVIESPTFRIAAVLDPPLNLLSELLELVLRDWIGGDWRSHQKLCEGFETHNAHIRAIVPADNLLEWEPKDGWQPLCDFLGKAVPAEPFPYSNKGDDVAKGLLLAARLRIAKWIVKRAVWPVMAAGAGGVSLLLLKNPRLFQTAVRWVSALRW